MKTQEEVKTPFRLSDEVAYQEGEVQRKEIISNSNGSVNMLAFGNNVMIARHSVNSDVFVYVVEGSVEFEIDNQRHQLKQGDSMIMSANTPHTVLALSDAKMILTKLHA